ALPAAGAPQPFATRVGLMRLLVVEDERTLAGYLRRGLEEAAWTVDLSETVEEAWRLLLLNPYDLVVLDLGLPGTDGGALLRRVREAGLDIPVLILTARGSVEDRVAGLDAGADDYLSKPFAFSELVARIRALSRRERVPRSATLRVGDLELDVLARQARRGPGANRPTGRGVRLLEDHPPPAGEGGGGTSARPARLGGPHD